MSLKPYTLVFKLLVLVLFSGFAILQAQSKVVNWDLKKSNQVLSDPSSSDSLQAIAILSISKHYIDINNDSSLIFAQKAYLIALRLKSIELEMQTSDFIGAVHIRLGNPSQALSLLLRAKELYQKLNSNTFHIVTNRNLGDLFKAQKDFSKSKQYFFEALTIKPQGPMEVLMRTWALMDLSDLYLIENKLDSAIFYAQQSYDLAIINTRKFPYSLKYVPIALNVIGQIYQREQSYSRAYYYFNLAIETAKKNGNEQAVSDNYLSFAKFYAETNKPDSSYLFGRKAFSIARYVNNPRAIVAVSTFLKDYFKKRGQLDSAFVYQEIMSNAKDQLLDIEKNRQVQNLAFQENIRQQELGIAEKDYQTRVRFIVLSIILGVLALLVGLLFFNYSLQNRANQLLQEQKREINHQKGEIETAYKTLQSTQAQLVQSEKLASLGELTAGIAHEIQNPLNFVNNFAEVSEELLVDMAVELDKGEITEAKAIAVDIKQNLQKINHHGKRASSIVKGMLDHSRTSSGKKEHTDINALADEYLRLAYHGFRAKDSDFNVTLETHFDHELPKIEVVSQDIGRVVLNLINNAFYAVGQKTKNRPATTDDGTYVPTVEVSTRGTAAGFEIKVADNGPGIPEALINKVFQPFFTTKPTGEGTGLGLSLSRDIIVNGHGGTLSITSTTEGKDTGTTFTIFLPIINPST